MKNNYLCADLHIHTALSPCGHEEMSPFNIVRYAELCGIDILAVTDHNSMLNVESVIEASKSVEVTVLPGIEVQTKEEVHILGIFPDLESGESFADEIKNNLPVRKHDAAIFGEQISYSLNGKKNDINNMSFVFSISLSLNNVIKKIKKYGGMSIASHIDRKAFSLIGQLGFIPPDLDIDALELSSSLSKGGNNQGIETAEKYPLIASSDAHSLKEIGTFYTEFLIEKPKLRNIISALRGIQGRDYKIKSDI